MNAPRDRIEFRPADHSYWLGEQRLPSVSELIAPLNPFRNGSLPYLPDTRWRGTAVHLACQLDDEGDLDEGSVVETVQPYLQAWRSFRAARIAETLAIERPLHSKRYGFAGTPDRVVRLRTAHLAILDLKTGAPTPVYAIQMSGYAQLAREHFDDGGKRVKRYAIQLSASAKFKLHEYKDETDFGVFVSCLSLWQWREKHA